MQKKQKLSSLFILLILFIGCGTNQYLSNQQIASNNDLGFNLVIRTNPVFNSTQRICRLAIHKNSLNQHDLKIAYNQVDLIKTSQIAKNNGAVAAINGGFFNMDEGGSVTYFEINDSVISKTRDPKLKWGVSDSIINGAIILSKENKLKIEYANTEDFYAKSKRESFVLFTGPVLIQNSELQKLPDKNFSNKRHPRTCVGITKDSIMFITIDGRSKQAKGMSLYELQKYLSDLGCTDAINLDGGGSTTMWTINKGVVNSPSDKSGERPVANALIILKSDSLNNN